jgi:hypothetical protein
MEKLKKHIILFATARTGGSYVTASIAYYHRMLNYPENILFIEPFGRNRLVPFNETYSRNHNNNIIQHRSLEEFRAATRLYSTSGKFPEKWREQITAATEISDLHMKTSQSYTSKVLVNQLQYLPEFRWRSLLTLPTSTTFLIYRQDLEDAVLSLIIANYSDIWNAGPLPEDLDSSSIYTNIKINIGSRTEMIVPTIRKYLLDTYILYYYWHNTIEWDYVIPYEDLSGDPIVDFQKYFDAPMESVPPSIVDRKTHRKLLTKEEKISKIEDYDVFRSILDSELKKLNMPLFLDRL